MINSDRSYSIQYQEFQEVLFNCSPPLGVTSKQPIASRREGKYQKQNIVKSQNKKLWCQMTNTFSKLLHPHFPGLWKVAACSSKISLEWRLKSLLLRTPLHVLNYLNIHVSKSNEEEWIYLVNQDCSLLSYFGSQWASPFQTCHGPILPLPSPQRCRWCKDLGACFWYSPAA